MRLNWRWFSRSEDRLGSWLAKQHEELVLGGKATPVGPCPGEAFLKDLARRARWIALSDSRIAHAAHCPTCMNRLLALRRERRSRQRKMVVTTVAVCAVIAAVLITFARSGRLRKQASTDLAEVSETVNLWDAGTIRGSQPGPLQSVSLPAAIVKLTIILPRFSPSGRYVVAVTQDQDGNGVVAQKGASAIVNGDHESVSVELDLRAAKAGAYFLDTTHGQDQASYYYPLQIR